EAPVRVAAANGLSGLRIGAKAKAPAVPALMEALKDRDAGLRAAAADTFSAIGPAAQAAVPELAAGLQAPGREVRWRAARALGAGALVLATLLLDIAGTTFGLVRAEIARSDVAEQRRIAEDKQKEAEDEKVRAEKAEEQTLAEFRASTDEAV